MTTADPVVTAESLYRFYRAGDDETLALKGVCLEVCAGEMVAVTGPSGSGKSTLLSCLAGLDEPSGGTVRICGERLSHQPEPVRARVRAQRIGVLQQNSNLFEHLTVRQNIQLAAGVAGHRCGDTESLLSTLGIKHRGDAYPSQLSGGEAARAGLAVALANDPPVLIADEPTGELDTGTESRLLHLLAELAARGAAVVLASHSAAAVAQAHRQVRLHDGQVLA